MDTIFMNSENSRSPEPHILKLKLTDKLDLNLDKKVIALSNYCIIKKVIALSSSLLDISPSNHI